MPEAQVSSDDRQFSFEAKTVPLSAIRFNEAIYPRKEGHDPAVVERYAKDIEQIEAAGALVSIAPDGDLLDGRHRHLAYQTRYAQEPDREIPVKVWDTTGDADNRFLAVKLNARHGLAFTDDDRKHSAIGLYNDGYTSPTIAKVLSVSEATVSKLLSRTIKEKKDRQNDLIRKLWLACYTNEEIGQAVGETSDAVRMRLKVTEESLQREVSSVTPHSHDFEVPLYNVWKQQCKSNAVGHFGNSEARWLDNLLYLYTEPLDIVVDPFAGGGSTIDVCKKRWRRYWCGDRKPKVSRHAENEAGGIREHDMVADDGSIRLPDLRGRWGNVKLVYLDPPYWKQAEGQYSNDPTDLANMSLGLFTNTLANIINDFAKKLTSSGGFIAVMLQPTQWNAPERTYTDHIVDVLRKVTLPIEMRFSVPYESQQCNAQMVEWAKQSRKVLVLSREIVVWRVAS
mgnify:CR=1 FL=1